MPRTFPRIIVALAAAVSSFVSFSSAQPPGSERAPSAVAQPAGVPQRWKGVVEIRGIKVDFGVLLQPATGDTPARGTIDIPPQGIKGAALSDVSINAEELRFTLAIAGGARENAAVFALKVAPGGKTAKGQLTQSGVVAPVTVELVPEGAPMSYGLGRPQEPRPPFPYVARDVTYTNAKDGTKLAGTLTLPEGPGPFAAVVMITGSGAQDRDESIGGHKPFLVIADHLTRRGIAVLRADDRGVGGSGGSVMDATAEDTVGDVLAGVALLKTVAEIDGAKIGVIGHSEGAIVGPMAAAASRDIAFVVMLAGTGVKGREILTMQSEAIMRAAKIDPALIAGVTALHRALMDQIERNAPEGEIADAIRELARAQVKVSNAVAGGAAPEPTDDQLDATVRQQLGVLNTKWFRSFFLYDPREALRRVKVPVLALIGALDVQVPAKDNLPEIEKALKEAGNTDATVRELPGLNHLFQTAATGGPAEYATIDETFSPAALAVISDWIAAHTSARK